MYGYIYETTNLVNGKKYIGKHKSKIFDNNYHGSGVALKKAIKKYGENNFKTIIIEKIYTNQKELDMKEKYWIEYFNAVKDKKYYNRSYGGENEGWAGVNKAFKEKGFSDETRRKMSESRKGKKHPMYGKHHTKESIEKMIKTKKGKKLSEENKKHISEALKGKNAPWYGKHLSESTKLKISQSLKKWNHLNFGNSKKSHKPFSEEAKLKMSKAKKGKKLSEQHRKNISKALKEKHKKEGSKNNYNIIAHNKNKICINNKMKNKYILKNDLEFYIKAGWILGGKSRRKSTNR